MSLAISPAVENVSSVIGNLDQKDATMDLFTSFKGLVLQQEVRVLQVNPEEAVFLLTDIEMSAALEGNIFLNSHLFPKPVKALVKSLDIKRCILVLSGFYYVDTGLTKRQHERVWPKQSTYVNLHWRGKAQRSCINNISVNGMGLMPFRIHDQGMKIHPGSKVQLDFKLSPGQTDMAIRGAVIYLNKIDLNLTTIGIKLFPNDRELRLLREYIAPRKQEILDELNQSFWDSIKPKGVESLYL